MDLAKLTKYLHEKCKNTLIVFVTPDYKKGLLLERFFPHFLILSGHGGAPTDIFNKNKKFIYEAKDLVSNFDEKKSQSGSLLEYKEAQEFLEKNAQTNKCHTIAILTFKGNSKIELICKKKGWRLLNVTMDLTTKLESKSNFSSFLKDYTYENLPMMTGVLNDLNLNKIELNKKYVLQFTRGFGGSSTVFLKGKDLIKTQQTEKGGHKVKITPFIKGATITLNGCIYGNEVYISHPFVQKTGLKKFTKYEGGSCGVDFDISKYKLDKNLMKKVVERASEIGKFCISNDFKGFFGLDFITDGDAVYPVEINPRLTANCHPFTANQINLKHVPFLVLHIMEFLGIRILIPNAKQFSQRRYVGETLVLRNISNVAKRVNVLAKNTKIKHAEICTYLDLLNKKCKSVFIPFGPTELINPDFEWGELWQL